MDNALDSSAQAFLNNLYRPVSRTGLSLSASDIPNLTTYNEEIVGIEA